MAVKSLEIKSRVPLAGGVSFGEAGPYDQLDGAVHFAVDPEHPANGLITDLELAPQDSGAMVTFTSDFTILRPSDPWSGQPPHSAGHIEPGHPAGPVVVQQLTPGDRPFRSPGSGQRLPHAPGIYHRLVWLAA